MYKSNFGSVLIPVDLLQYACLPGRMYYCRGGSGCDGRHLQNVIFEL
jgi:hypothetical protein